MDRIADLVEQATALLARALAVPLTELDDVEVVTGIEQVEAAGRLADALRCAIAGEVDERSTWALGSEGLAFRCGHRKGVQLVEQLTRVSAAEAARRVALAAVIRPRFSLHGEVLEPERPSIARAVRAGEVGLDAARAIHQMLTQAERGSAEPEAVRIAEAELAESALTNTADHVRCEARVWREYLDPDGVEPREEAIRAARAIRLGRERHGLTPISGDLDQEFAALLRASFAESLSPDARPRFLSEEDRVAVAEREVAFADGRTREQRQHDVLLGLLTAGTRSTGLGAGEMRSLTTVMATITVGELDAERGIGWLDEVDEPVSAGTIAMLACDAGFRLELMSDTGCPLDEGRRQRFFTPAQRRALAIRDGGCVWPLCTAPPSWTHAHHCRSWQNGGRSDIDNGVLLCPAHHRMLHHGGYEVRMLGGLPHLVAPPGLDPAGVPRLVGRARWRRSAPRAAPSWRATGSVGSAATVLRT